MRRQKEVADGSCWECKVRGQWELKIEEIALFKYSIPRYSIFNVYSPLFDLYDHHRHVVGLGGATGEGPDGVVDMVKDIFS